MAAWIARGPRRRRRFDVGTWASRRVAVHGASRERRSALHLAATRSYPAGAPPRDAPTPRSVAAQGRAAAVHRRPAWAGPSRGRGRVSHEQNAGQARSLDELAPNSVTPARGGLRRMLASARREATRRVGFARAGRDALRRGRRGACRGTHGRSDEISKGHDVGVVPTPFVPDLAGPSAQILLVHPRWLLQSAHFASRRFERSKAGSASTDIPTSCQNGRRGSVARARRKRVVLSRPVLLPAGIELKRTPLVPLSAASHAGGRIGSQTTIETAEPLRARRRRSQHGFGQG